MDIIVRSYVRSVDIWVSGAPDLVGGFPDYTVRCPNALFRHLSGGCFGTFGQRSARRPILWGDIDPWAQELLNLLVHLTEHERKGPLRTEGGWRGGVPQTK